MIGTFQGYEVMHGSFGHHYSTIDGRVYLTWFDLTDSRLVGLRAGAEVEYEFCPAPTVLCGSPAICENLPSARLARILRKAGDV